VNLAVIQRVKVTLLLTVLIPFVEAFLTKLLEHKRVNLSSEQLVKDIIVIL